MTTDTNNLQISSTTEEPFTFISKKPLVQKTKVVKSNINEKFNTTVKVEQIQLLQIFIMYK